MADEAIRFLPYDEAAALVAAIQEEEDIDDPERRVLMVYNHEDKAICWFDFDEVMRDAGLGDAGRAKGARSDAARQAVTDYVLHHIPDWAREG